LAGYRDVSFLGEAMEPRWCEANSSASSGSAVTVTIAELAAMRLRSNGYSALKNVRCTFEEGSLILRGFVPTYYLKQLAQHAVAKVDGVEWIDNQIEVAGGAALHT
jgi:osmotically-inducible protein OsmY